MDRGELERFYRAAVALAAEMGHDRLREIVLKSDDGGFVRFTVPPECRQNGQGNGRPRRTHNSTFTAVEWDGRSYTFTPLQAACVRVLWEAWERGDPPLHQADILTEAQSEQQRLAPVFRTPEGTHPAWGTMIEACPQQHFRLREG